jgi:hypothetical protein
MKRTPRQILFQRHQPAEAKLDQMRRKFVSELAGETAPAGEAMEPMESDGINLRAKLWRELILPSRRVWTGVAAAWIVIAVLNLETSEGPHPARTASPAPTPEIMAALEEQKRLFSELIHAPEAQTPQPPRHGPRPRSEMKVDGKMG